MSIVCLICIRQKSKCLKARMCGAYLKPLHETQRQRESKKRRRKGRRRRARECTLKRHVVGRLWRALNESVDAVTALEDKPRRMNDSFPL